MQRVVAHSLRCKGLGDEELVARSQADDRVALELLLQRYRRPLLGARFGGSTSWWVPMPMTWSRRV